MTGLRFLKLNDYEGDDRVRPKKYVFKGAIIGPNPR
jgi:hypothetical protein